MIIETQLIWENKIDGNQTTNQINIFEKLKAKGFIFEQKALELWYVTKKQASYEYIENLAEASWVAVEPGGKKSQVDVYHTWYVCIYIYYTCIYIYKLYIYII